jgi:hypothetical protein
MTLGQALLGMVFLINMELAWWEAVALFVLFVIPFLSPAAAHITMIVYYAWVGVELVRMILGWRKPLAFQHFAKVWKTHINHAA